MLYKLYMISSFCALFFFSIAQYQGWSFSSEEGERSSTNNLHSSGGNYNSGSHRGSYHK